MGEVGYEKSFLCQTLLQLTLSWGFDNIYHRRHRRVILTCTLQVNVVNKTPGSMFRFTVNVQCQGL